MKKNIKILIADDHEIVRNGVKIMLSHQNTFNPQIEEVDNGEDFIRIVEKEKFDIVLLDVNLPNYNGIKLTEFLTQKNKSTKIIALSMHTETYIVQGMLKAGAHGYLTKNVGVEELAKAVTTVLSGRKYFCNEITQTLLMTTDHSLVRGKELRLNKLNILSEQEVKIITLVSKELTNSEIATKLNISKRTVESHRRNIMTKVKVQNTAGMIVFAAKNGLI